MIDFSEENIKILSEKIKSLNVGDTSDKVYQIINFPLYEYSKVLSKKIGEDKGYAMVFHDYKEIKSRPEETKDIIFYFSPDERLQCLFASNVPELNGLMPCR